MAPDLGIRELKDHGNGNADGNENFFSINADSDHGRPMAGLGRRLAPWLPSNV